MLVPLLSLYPLQSLLSFHTAALSLGCQRFLMLTVGGWQKASQSRPEITGPEHLYDCDATHRVKYLLCFRSRTESCVHTEFRSRVTYGCMFIHAAAQKYALVNMITEQCRHVLACGSPHLELVGVLCVLTGDVALPFLGDRKGKEEKNDRLNFPHPVTRHLHHMTAVKLGAKMKMTPCYITGISAGATLEWPLLTTSRVALAHKTSTLL